MAGFDADTGLVGSTMDRVTSNAESAGAWDESLRAVSNAAQREDVQRAMHAFYARADARIAAQPGTCWNKGACCRFGEFGHRLYVTALEVAYYLAMGDSKAPGVTDVCPHAFAGKCHVRERRPLGCRIFFCDPAAQEWQGPLTEELLGELRRMHDDLGVSYFYADWMTLLRQLNGSVTGGGEIGRASVLSDGKWIQLGLAEGKAT